ncbi:MAG: glutamyl-tRNA reductase [Acidobacteria bacterium]|nr:glutamyl-tRNA reductase [Acidobacteriota bacterium]
MHLLVVGISHHTAPLELRERLDFQARGIDQALHALAQRGSTREAVVLSTCNRAEIYAACDELEAARGDVVAFVSAFNGVPACAVTPHVYEAADLEAARHLFRVAAGLDSLVVGEPQILGQVKAAHTIAAAGQRTGPVLNRLFHASFGVGKRVRTETRLGSGAVSVGFAAVSLARKIFGDLAGRSVLVVGAGEMGKLTARHMKSQGVSHVTIVSRTMAHAARTAEAIGGANVAPWDDLDAAIAGSDIVIAATGAAAPILTKARIEALMRPRRNRALFVIDIAMPRDVEPAAGEIEQVFLYNLDDLQAAVRENLARRATEVALAERIVAEEVEKFGIWVRSRSAIPTVVALRQHFEDIRRTELDRLAFKTASMPPDARARLDEITRLIVEKLLLHPTEQLKLLGDTETVGAYADALTRLFALSERALDAPDAPRDDSRVEPFRPKERGRR